MATQKKKNAESARPHFSKKESVILGFELAKKNILFFIGIFVIVAVIFIVSESLQFGSAAKTGVSGYGIVNIISFLVNVVISMGLIKISLEFVDKKKPKFSDLLYIKPFWYFLLGSLMRGVITVIGLILLIIPGIVFSIRLQFVTYLIVDKNMHPIDAIKKSWAMTKGNTWNLFFFGILLALINILGALILLVGLFVTVPLTMLATTFVYRKLLLQSKAS